MIVKWFGDVNVTVNADRREVKDRGNASSDIETDPKAIKLQKERYIMFYQIVC